MVASAPKGEMSKDYSSSKKVPLKNHSEQDNFEQEHLLHVLPALKSRQNTSYLRLRAGSLCSRCTGVGSDKWHCCCARCRVVESPISLSCENCYSKFDLGWVTDSHSPSGSMDYQLEDTNHNHGRWLITLSNIYKWIPFHEIQRLEFWLKARKCC